MPKGKSVILVDPVYRVQKYERDLRRWEYMEDEQQRQNQKLQ